MTTTHPVIFHDATPAMADVISGSTHRPEPLAPGEDVQRWAMNTHAWLRAVIFIAGDRRIDLATTLLAGPGATVNDGAVWLARDQFGEPDATVLAMGSETDAWLIALNEDGTRACTIDVAALAAAGDAMAAAILADWSASYDDLPPELDFDQLAEIARAWPWNVRDALARFVATAMNEAGIDDRRKRYAVEERLGRMMGDI